ncbi:MAG: anaerobic ribonucleoside-triphosphate reductase activating protein [Bacilli bacterium]|nr:anaerobic ribonucleoside-triphosphate reductase activating protein [Bacilli bacterium]
MKIRLASPVLQTDSIVDGEGIRAVLWTQGCAHKCPGCHNPQTHSFDEGFELDIEEIKQQIDSLEGQDGVTFSGGDPFYQVEACLEIAKYIKKKKMNIWCYTGFIYESLILLSKQNPKIKELLKTIDVLIDGPFVLEEKSFDCVFRGSKNQRIINTKESLKNKKVCLVEKYYVTNKKDKRERIYI